jgi:catechol 2,3-dioxygenase-like lactoylglutathione lyase family enzyme
MAEAQLDPVFGDAFRTWVQGRRDAVAAMLHRAVARGDLAADLDIDHAVDLIFGPLWYRLLVGHATVDPVRLESPVTGDFTVRGMQTPTAGITRDIYGMPAFVTFVVADLTRTVDWYTNGLDFIELFSMPGPDGPRLVHLRRWRYQDILVRPGGGTGGGQFSVMAGIEELDALAARAAAHGGGGSVTGPFDTPWNTRDVHATDPDGYTVVYTAHRPAPRQDAEFNAMMVREARRQGLGG